MFPLPPNSAAASFGVGLVPMHPPEVVEQAEQLIDFCKCLRIQEPPFKGDSVAQAASIRLWMESCEEIQNLEILYLSESFLSHLPPEIGLFRSLKKLDISKNQLTTLPAEIISLGELTYLNISENQLKTLPAEISALSKLMTLDVSTNQLETLPAEIGSFRELGILNISKNRLKTLPAEMGNLSELQYLRASHNLFETFPAEIGSLRELDLSGNQLKEIPAEIGQLDKLIWLTVAGNQLETLPIEIGSLKDLAYLDVSGNQLETLPAEVGNFEILTHLRLSRNRLENLPAEIANLENLEILMLGQNRLEAFPAEIVKLRKLEHLDISTNRFKIFPAEIAHLGNLGLLNISFNQLETMSPAIGQLVELHTLDVSKNRLESLPPEMGNLRKLVRLDLRHNRLEALPAEMGNFQALEFIDLSYNQLVALPVEMRKLAQLHQAIFTHNRFQHLINQLDRWSSAFEQTFFRGGDLRLREHRLLLPMLSLNDEHQMLSKYLQKLERLAHGLAEVGARQSIILRVECMIQLAGKNLEFGHIMLAQISDGLEACGDRALLTFNEIEIQWQFHHKELDDAEFRSLAIRAGRYELVKQHAIKVAVAKGLGDHVETILGFHLGLRDDLEFPITMTEMLYQGASGVTPQMLESARAILEGYTDEQVLAHSEHWKSRMTQKYPTQAEGVDLKYGEWCEAAELFFQCPELAKILTESGDYNAAMKAIAGERAKALAGFGTVIPKIYRT